MSFGENVALLAITATLTGLLVPTIRGLMDGRRFKQQKQYEAEIARESAIIEAQVQLLEDLSHLLWKFILSMIAVSFYALNGDHERAETAFEQYSDSVGDQLGGVQAELSKANRLVPTERVNEFQEFYRLLLSLDVELLTLTRSGWESPGWSVQHRKAFEAQAPLATALSNLAADMRLAAPESGPAQGPFVDRRQERSDR
jgi:hypothetical protein